MVISLTGNVVTPSVQDIRHTQADTCLFIEDNNLGKGTLFIAGNRLTWIKEDGLGLSLEYPDISLHAISKDLANFGHPCIYLMVQSESGQSSDLIDMDQQVQIIMGTSFSQPIESL